MRFEDLFDDLAAQAAATSERALWDEAQELRRAEVARQPLSARVPPGARVRIWLRGGHHVAGTVSRVGRDLYTVQADAVEWLVPHAAVRRMAVARRSELVRTESVRLSRLVRALGRDRAQVTLLLDDGSTVHGRVGESGRDHLELLQAGSALLLASDAVAALMLRSASTA